MVSDLNKVPKRVDLKKNMDKTKVMGKGQATLHGEPITDNGEERFSSGGRVNGSLDGLPQGTEKKKKEEKQLTFEATPIQVATCEEDASPC
ncbi:hypothetical protein EVAR_60322_1 [Eumeta japonica]|uniref:Uncharacterized protein n=1 Tax=Eumeta variegata TaxID=151549 RepID=A0A4C1ZB80_EUMVA|nr:hypothetical protein EVAR_60322_1 [Eumeta japonica]